LQGLSYAPPSGQPGNDSSDLTPVKLRKTA
jgi:hypothetical protein